MSVWKCRKEVIDNLERKIQIILWIACIAIVKNDKIMTKFIISNNFPNKFNINHLTKCSIISAKYHANETTYQNVNVNILDGWQNRIRVSKC